MKPVGLGAAKASFTNASPKTILETLLMPVEVDFDPFQPIGDFPPSL